MRRFSLLLLLALSLQAMAQPRLEVGQPTPLAGLLSAKVRGGPAGDVQVYFHQAPTRGPVIIVLQGSGMRPLVELSGNRSRSSMIFFDLVCRAETLPYHLVLIERKGLHSFGQPGPTQKMSEQIGGVQKSVRVQEVVDTVEAFHSLPWVSEIAMCGHSEGADTAAAVSRRIPEKLAALGLFAGPGPSRFFDFIMEARQAANSQAVVEILQEEIALASRTQEGTYRGAPYQYEKSYAIESTSLEDLLTHHLPLFVVQGGRDTHVSPASGDVSVVELLRDPKRPLTYLVCPDLDHGFMDWQGEAHEMELWEEFLEWLQNHRKQRQARLWRPLPAH
jgi:pimeloyl-ACP methyl ester carboxylesterase